MDEKGEETSREGTHLLQHEETFLFICKNNDNNKRHLVKTLMMSVNGTLNVMMKSDSENCSS